MKTSSKSTFNRYKLFLLIYPKKLKKVQEKKTHSKTKRKEEGSHTFKIRNYLNPLRTTLYL